VSDRPKRSDPGYMKWWYSQLTPEQRRKRLDKSNRWNTGNRDRLKANTRTWREKNPDLVMRQRRRQTLRKYGLTLEKYEEMVAAQDGACAICGEKPEQLVPDHDHCTGKLRELLCSNCNTVLGMATDDPDRLREAAKYLERHQSAAKAVA